MNWRRIALIIGAGAATTIAAAVPATTVIIVPVLGSLSASAGLASLAAFLGGWAMRTPGHGPEAPRS